MTRAYICHPGLWRMIVRVRPAICYADSSGDHHNSTQNRAKSRPIVVYHHRGAMGTLSVTKKLHTQRLERHFNGLGTLVKQFWVIIIPARASVAILE